MVCGRDALTISILVIKPEWLQMIMDGIKVWEIRKGACLKDGQTIYLVPSEAAAICARATFVTSHGPLSQDQWIRHSDLHCVHEPNRPYGSDTYGWELRDIEVAHQPIPIVRKKGAVKWQNVRLSAQIIQAQFEQRAG